MATESQNFFKHNKDTFSLVFSVTDVTENLNGYYAFWCAAADATSTILVHKNTFNGNGNPGPFDNAPTGEEEILISNQTITIPFDQNDFGTGLLEVGTYYHELTIGSLANGNDSVVIASGEFTVKADLGIAIR
tara:strand:+ start:549 stop:947 length:399 start_codon:yes stop_codon:yes gene_type:complete